MIYATIISFAAGIMAQNIFDFNWSTALFLVLIILIIGGALWKENYRYAKLILIVGTALTLGSLRTIFTDVSPDQRLLSGVGKEVSFEAAITSEPDVRDESVRYIVAPKLENGSESRVLINADPYPLYSFGDKIKVTGKLELPKNFIGDNGEEFDYVSYLAKEKIHFLIYRPKIDPTSSRDLGLRGTDHIVKYLYDLKNKFIENIGEVVPEPNSSLASGMIFGAKQSLGEDLLEKFKKVGLIHIVVLSGQNITIIAAGLFFLTTYFLNRNKGLVVSAVGMILFGIMVGLTATVLRALVMALIAVLARYLGRPQDGLRALFIAGFLMIAYNPLTLLSDPSFHLSFMATLGLILFTPLVYRYLPFITYRFGLREIVATTVAVQIFILPLLIRMSGSISLISFIVNPLVLPFTATVMALSALTGALGFLSIYLSWPLGALTYLITEFIIKVVELGSSIPYVNIPIGSLPNFIILIWYGGYFFLYKKIINREAVADMTTASWD